MWQLWGLPLAILFSSATSRIPDGYTGSSVKTSVFLSEPFFLRPGSVVDKYYFNIPFPKGHIGIKSFNGEVVDENGVPVPLHEAYLHHWTVERYYAQRASKSELVMAGNSGLCMNAFRQDFGLGSETRRTATWTPDPYALEIGNPKEVSDGYEEGWRLNIHAIDTRGVKDRSGCAECKCSLYNVTVDEYGQPLDRDYIGGLHCCYDRTQCELREGFNGGGVRKLYLRYTVKWVEWDETVVPVKIYILDVTDTGKILDDSDEERTRSICKVEYQVQLCDKEGNANDCVDTKKAEIVLPRGGDVVYAVAHQHAGGIGSALYGQDGRLLCTSLPTYGTGEEAGDEDGYIVGMSTCYPEPGSVRIADGELLTIVSNYSSNALHTGVMGLFYILVAEPLPQSKSDVLFFNQIRPWTLEVKNYWWAFVFSGGIIVIAAAIIFHPRNGEGYESL